MAAHVEVQCSYQGVATLVHINVIMHCTAASHKKKGKRSEQSVFVRLSVDFFSLAFRVD